MNPILPAVCYAVNGIHLCRLKKGHPGGHDDGWLQWDEIDWQAVKDDKIKAAAI